MLADARSRLWMKLKSAYFRITFSRYSAAFFLFGFLHCLAVGMVQSFMFNTDANASSLVGGIIREAEVPVKEIPWLTRPHGEFHLQLCQDIPHGSAPYPYCATVFQSGQQNISVMPGYRRSNDGLSPDSQAGVTQINVNEDITSSATTSPSGNVTGVSMQMGDSQGNVLLDLTCTRVLVYPRQVLENSRREDIASICYQIWLFWLSFVAVVYDSVPHTVAVLIVRVLTTGWSAYTIWRLDDVKLRFETLVSGENSACQVDLFPGYFSSRQGLEIADLVLNCTALLISVALGWNLVKTYSQNTFKAVGPPPEIKRIYRYFLSIYICLQLSAFTLVLATALWVDQLHNSPITAISDHTVIYMAAFIFTAVCLIPWLVMGWISVRREMKRVMLAFLTIGFILIAGWAVMFYSEVYRWLFVQWPFFAIITLQAFIVMITSCVLGCVCWRHFNQGLAEFLYVETVLDSEGFEPDIFARDVEKAKSSFDLEKDEPPFIATLHKHD